MEIVVNEKEVSDFSEPSEDQSLGDYLEELADELSETNRAFRSIRVDGELYNNSFDEKSCSEINRLELEIEDYENLTIRSIGDLGAYCHKFLDRIPEILDDWEDTSRDKIEEYRQQVVDAVGASEQVLSSVSLLTNISENDSRRSLRKRAQELIDDLQQASPEELSNLFRNTLQEYFNDLLGVLEDTLNEIEQREEEFLNQVEEMKSSMSELVEDTRSIVTDVREQGREASEKLLELQDRLNLAERLTKINRYLNRLDQAGKLKTFFSPERQEKVEQQLQKLYDGIAKLLGQLDKEQPQKAIKLLEEEITPYLDKFRGYLDELTSQSKKS